MEDRVFIVLIMHGMPPRDFPEDEKIRFYKLRAAMKDAGHIAESRDAHDSLDAKMRDWPRTPENDPFYTFSMGLGRKLEKKTGSRTVGHSPRLKSNFQRQCTCPLPK